MKFNKRVTKVLTITVIAMFALTAIVSIPGGDSDADTVISVKDGDGHTITLTEPAVHVAAIGKGASATVTELGKVQKIVVTDTYSKNATESIYSQLKQLIEEGKCIANGNMYTSGIAALKVDLIDSVEKGMLDKEKDVIILSGGSKKVTDETYTYLTSADIGFKNVLTWSSITSYDQIIEFVESISKVVTGGESDEVKKMKYVRDYIKDTLKANGVTEDTKHKCFYVTWSSKVFKVGNTGSLGTSLLQAAGGNAVTIDPSISSTTYETSLPGIIDEHGSSVVVAADSSIIANEKVNDLKANVGDVKIVPMESLWNNYCIESMNGVWTMASAMYPDYFNGDVPSLPDQGNNDSFVYYIVGGVVGCLIVIAAVVLIMRHR